MNEDSPIHPSPTPGSRWPPSGTPGTLGPKTARRSASRLRPGPTGDRPLIYFPLFCLLLTAAGLSACGAPGTPAAPAPRAASETASPPATRDGESAGEEVGQPGGQLRLAATAEPRTLNPVTAVAGPSLAVLEHLHAGLVRFHPPSFRVRAELAERIEEVSDRIIRFHLRRNIRFSDGEPFDADDVAFTFRAMLDPAMQSIQREHLLIDGEPIEVRKIDSHTVEAELPTAIAAALELFDAVAILPEHRLGPAYREGRLGEVWGVGTALEQIVGLGPFRLRSYLPGERLELERNPHYWKRDAADQPLPYLQSLIFSYVADDEAQVLRFAAGESHLIQGIDTDSFARLRSRAEAPFEVHDLGPGLAYEFLFFNANPSAPERRPELAEKQVWFGDSDFRRALSLAIDRRAIARLAYGGLATPIGGAVTPANHRWHDPAITPPPFDPTRASELLSQAGFVRDGSGGENGGGPLRAPSGNAVSLTLVTNSSNPQRTQAAAVIQEDLRKVGIEVKVVTLEFGALLERVYSSFDYDLCLLGLGRGALDPDAAAAVFRSDGDTHLWDLSGREPTEAWQQELDSLFDAQRIELDPAERLRLYHRAQALVAENAPAVFLVAPNVLVGTHPALGNIAPVPLDPPITWNAERFYWRQPATP
ncbi:MAG: ABC transporter substrate-binding protein [Holophagales bacterium]|nr:ABC transporter substrate-binding protein [Holophagales bacterium]